MSWSINCVDYINSLSRLFGYIMAIAVEKVLYNCAMTVSDRVAEIDLSLNSLTLKNLGKAHSVVEHFAKFLLYFSKLCMNFV